VCVCVGGVHGSGPPLARSWYGDGEVVPIEHDGGGLGEMPGLTGGGDDERLLVQDESMPCSGEEDEARHLLRLRRPKQWWRLCVLCFPLLPFSCYSFSSLLAMLCR
jgi:hypothetical protein